MERTRIVLIDMPPLLRDIVREASRPEPDLDVVAEHEGAVDLRDAVERDERRLRDRRLGRASDECVRSLVARERGVRALEVRSDGKESVLYELRPHRVSLGEISSETLVRTIRAVPAWDAEP